MSPGVISVSSPISSQDPLTWTLPCTPHSPLRSQLYVCMYVCCLCDFTVSSAAVHVSVKGCHVLKKATERERERVVHACLLHSLCPWGHLPILWFTELHTPATMRHGGISLCEACLPMPQGYASTPVNVTLLGAISTLKLNLQWPCLQRKQH